MRDEWRLQYLGADNTTWHPAHGRAKRTLLNAFVALVKKRLLRRGHLMYRIVNRRTKEVITANQVASLL